MFQTFFMKELQGSITSKTQCTIDENNYWGERERTPTLLMSMEIVYVRASTSDRHTAHARTLFEFC